MLSCLPPPELSSRLDVSFGSLKRFESSGQISLEWLWNFSFLCEVEEEKFESIDEVFENDSY